jgi:class 3 adenylate cyclase/tetratricopeptide (TPR) repeat protein
MVEATLTVLFTDAVASTEALARLGDERFGVVQESHLDLLRNAVDAHGGREIKSLGDGLMVEFTGAADALATAVSMQQAVEAHARGGEEGLPLRVGVSSGDVTVADDGDLHGTAVVEAARLCAAAAAGQILGTETVRVLAGSRGGHAYTSLGPIELKGLTEPVGAVEVGWAPLAEAGGLAPVPLPPRLAFESAYSFVGRAAEVERLDGLWRQVVGGVRVALLAGEPGAGKTRLAQEIAARAHEQGGLVLFGRVDEDLAVAYQPFAEALRHYLVSVDEATRERVLDLRGGVLARLVPELVEEVPEGQIEAWAIFEGLVDWLSMESENRPVVLVLDDIHWAPKPTLQALMHLVRSERLSRLLIVGTYRDTELDRRHPLADVLADLRRIDGVERVAVRGLDPDGVAAFVQAMRGDALDEDSRELVELISEQTQGNPFFVGQVLRNLAESGAIEQVEGRWVRAEGAEQFVVPEGVREVVGRRVSRLSRQAGDLLTVAAVTGAQFDVAIVAEVAEQPMAEALDSLDEALAARLVLESGSPGRLRFAHALVRQTLEDELSTMRRLHTHQQIGLALERRFGDAESAVADLAHHFAEAAALGEGERAARYAEHAASQASGRAAPEQAADLLEQALELLPVDTDPDGLWRERLYAQLIPCLWVMYDLERLEEFSREWLALARELGDDVMLLTAVPWVIDSFTWVRPPETGDFELIAEALGVDVWSLELSGRRRLSLRRSWRDLDAASLRAWLLANLSTDWAFGLPLQTISDQLPGKTPLDLADEACRVAAQSADPESADEALFFRTWNLVGSPDAESQLQAARQLTEMDIAVFGGGRVIAGLALARLGRLDDLCDWADQALLAAERSGDRLLLANAHAQQALEAFARGRPDDARRAHEEALRPAPEEPSTLLAGAVFAVAQLLASGQANEARQIAEQLDSTPLYDCSHLLGAVAAAQGDTDTARAVLDAWHASDRPLIADFMHSARLWGYAECAHATDDKDAARHLYEELVPYDGQLLLWAWVFVPSSAAFTLGLLAETLGERERALAHYSDALSFEEEIGATTLARRTHEALAGLG